MRTHGWIIAENRQINMVINTKVNDGRSFLPNECLMFLITIDFTWMHFLLIGIVGIIVIILKNVEFTN